MQDAVVNLPFPYLLMGSRQGRADSVVAHAPMAIRTIASDEAPESLRWGGVPRRTFDGLHLVPLDDGGNPADTLAWLGPGRRISDADWRGTNLPSFHSERAGTARSPLMLETEANALVKRPRSKTDGRAQGMAAAAQIWRENLFLVEGKPHVVAPEPRHVVVSENGRVVAMTSANPVYELTTFHFRLDHRDQALAFARRLATSRGVKLHDRTVDVEVPDPSLLTFDGSILAAQFIVDRVEWTAQRKGGKSYAALCDHGAEKNADWARDVLSSADIAKDVAGLPRPDNLDCKDMLDAWSTVADAYVDDGEEISLSF